MQLAILGDLVDPRKMTGREHTKTHKELRQVLAEINRDYPTQLVTELQFIHDDQFFGRLNRADELMIILERILAGLDGHPVLFGLGLAMADDLRTDDLTLATQALDRLKHTNRRSSQPKSLIRLESAVFDPALINLLFSQLSYQLSSWTDRQRRIVWQMRRAPSQKELADRLGVSQPYINQVLQATGYYSYRASLQGITHEIKRQLFVVLKK